MNPVNFNFSQISTIASKFAEKHHYTAGVTNLCSFVKDELRVRIEYSDDVFDKNGGSIVVDKTKGSTIRLSRFTASAYDNLTLGHELGHYVLHSRCGREEIAANNTGNNEDKLESEANAFAYAFLMPEDIFKQQYKNKNQNIIGLANYFNLPVECVKYRCKSLGLCGE